MQRLLVLFLLFCFTVSYAQKKLLSKTWEVIEIKGIVLPVDSISLPLIKLENARLTGHSSCNRMFGDFVVNRKEIQFTNIGGTKMYCSLISNLFENRLYQALKEVKYWKILKNKLYFYNKNSEVILILIEKKNNLK